MVYNDPFDQLEVNPMQKREYKKEMPENLDDMHTFRIPQVNIENDQHKFIYE